MLLKSSKSLVFDAAILNGFLLFKRSADLKTFVCLCVARCGTRPRLLVSRILTSENWEQVFKSKMVSTKETALKPSN